MGNGHHNGEIHEETIRHHDVAYEHSDLGSRGIYGVLVGFAIFIVFVLLVTWGLLRYFGGFRITPRPAGPASVARYAAVPGGDPALRFPTPVLQPDPVADLNKFRAANEERLNTYGWVNQQAGVVRIPISRAMDLVAQRGLPTRSNAGVPVSQAFGSAPLLGGGVVPLRESSLARGEPQAPSNAPESGAERPQDQSGGQRQKPGIPQER
jgi:hypothetical protein